MKPEKIALYSCLFAAFVSRPLDIDILTYGMQRRERAKRANIFFYVVEHFVDMPMYIFAGNAPDKAPSGRGWSKG